MASAKRHREYWTNLTDEQWACVQAWLERRAGAAPRPRGGAGAAAPTDSGHSGHAEREDHRGRRGVRLRRGKKVSGRKRHYLVDTEGHLLAVLVYAADIGDREGARWVISY